MDPVGSVVVGRWGGGEMLRAGKITRGEAKREDAGATWGDTGSGTMDPVSIVVGTGGRGYIARGW